MFPVLFILLNCPGTPVSGDLTPAPGLLEELQDKKDRVKKRLMETDSDKEDRPEYKEKRKVGIKLNVFLKIKLLRKILILP